MQYLLLLVVILMLGLQGLAQKQYDVMSKTPNVFLFSAVTASAALLFFVVGNGFRLHLSGDFLPYAIAFGLAYGTCTVASFYTIVWGSMSISNLVTSYSLIIPTFYGLIALDESLSAFGMVGLAALFLSIFLINDRKEDVKFSVKWLIALAVAFIGNGLCSTVQKMQQTACAGAYKNDFMITALMIVVVTFVVMALLRRERLREGLAVCAGLGALKGVANGIVNLLVMVLTGSLPNAILFPSISAGGIVIGFLIAVGIYKERLTRRQLLGYAIGTVSVVLLNL